MQIGSKSQSSLEYLIVMGIAIFILSAAISYAIYYQIGYNSAGTSQDLQLAATSIANAVNSLSGSGVGSSQQFSFSSPGLNLVSSICNTSISLSYGGEEASQSLSLYTTGELPVSSGTYVGKVTLVKNNGKPEAQIAMDLPISYISTSYIYNPSSIFYNVSFLDTNGNLVGNVNFTIIIYNHNKIVAEQNESTLSGYYSGSITPLSGGQFSSSSTAEIYVKSLNIISPSCFLPQQLLLVPKGILNFVSLTIKNSESVSTSSPFQQEVVVDSADYQQYEASNLQNVEFFYPNGTTIDSWLESGNSNTATNSLYWLKLSGVPASSSITVYMGFASKSANLFNNTNDGEAPQLTCPNPSNTASCSTYAEYDDGANVFNNYWNFAGSVLPKGWYSTGSASAVVSNGLIVPAGPDANAFYNLTAPLSGILEVYNNEASGQTAGYSQVGIENFSLGTGLTWIEINNQPTVISPAYLTPTWVFHMLTPPEPTNTYAVTGVYYQNPYATWYYNGQAVQTYDYGTSDIFKYIQIYNGGSSSGGNQISVKWVRIRAYPPNGIMPSVTFGPVEPQITVFVNGVKDGNNGIADGDITNITAFGIQASHIGLMINGSLVVPLGSASLSYQKPLSTGLYNVTVFSNQSNLANQTYWEAVANIPKNVKEFVPISITNLQSTATSSIFQDNVSINSFGYNSFENNTLSNIEFFSPSGSVIPSWLESGDLAYFNGVNSYANLPENYPFGTASTFTISVWFKTTSDGVVIWNGDSEQVSSAGCYSPIIYVNTNGDLAGGDWVGSQPFNTNYFVANGKWTFITIVQTPSQQILYLNGTEVATYSGTPQACPSAYWTIGEGYTSSGWADTNNGNFYFNGYISNVQFYNQVFSSSKVALLYDKGIAGSPLNSSGLIAWYLLAGNGNQSNGHNILSINNITFNGVSSASTSTNYWLKLGSIQPRESYIAFMGFALPNITLFNTVNDGEAPQLSPTYAEYDDGANVFTAYSNFAGTNLPSDFTSYVGSATLTVNNGLNIQVANNGCSSTWAGIIYNNPINAADSIVETYSSGTRVAGPEDVGIYTGNSDTAGGYAGVADTWGWGYGTISGGYGNIGNPFDISSGSGVASIYWIGNGDEGVGWNYNFVSSSNTNEGWSSSLYASIQDGECSPGANMEYYWFRVRSYPPNGIMPVKILGPLNGQVT